MAGAASWLSSTLRAGWVSAAGPIMVFARVFIWFFREKGWFGGKVCEVDPGMFASAADSIMGLGVVLIRFCMEEGWWDGKLGEVGVLIFLTVFGVFVGASSEQGFLSDAGGASYINLLEKFMGWEKCVEQTRGFIKHEIGKGDDDPGRD